MAPALETALRKSFDYLGKPSLRILDFGAGKLRHTVPLLELGHQVTAVDYRDLFDRPSDQVKENLAIAKTHGNRFGQLVYPSDFVALNDRQFDLVLLINVLNIMPDPLERLFVIEHCGKRLRANQGHVLIFCQHGDSDQIAAAADAVTDGGCTEGKGRKTFYKDYNDRDEIIRLVKVMGFKHEESVKIDAGKNHALLFKKSGPEILLTKPVIEQKRRILERQVYLGESQSEVAVANVLDADSYVGFGAALGATLTNLKRGRNDAYAFENIITVIIEYIFRNHFTNSSIRQQFEIHKKHKRIDIKAEWRANSSLKTIITDNNLKSSFVPIECKNYSARIGNVEFGQMVDRCDQRHRHFGIIICREAGDRDRIIEDCNTRFNSHNYLIIVLDDSDLQQLLLYSDQLNDEEIVKYISHKITEVRDLG
jgi:SAM-dependent methyltransferase